MKICRLSIFATVLLGGGATAGLAHAAPPNEPGPYAVGHTSFVVVDPARLDPVLGTIEYPMLVHVWFPAPPGSAGTPVEYSANSPILTVAPGGGEDPACPARPYSGIRIPSSLARDDLPVAEPPGNGFPMIVYSHGFTELGASSWQAKELLASHGFVVVAPEHTQDTIYASFAPLLADPENPVRSVTGHELAAILFDGDFTHAIPRRVQDLRLAISSMLERIAAPGDPFHGKVDADRIGVEGFSLGGPSALAAAVGIEAAGIAGDPRVDAVLLGDGELGPHTKYLGALAFSNGDLGKVEVPILSVDSASGRNLGGYLLAHVTSEVAISAKIRRSGHVALSGNFCLVIDRALDAAEDGSLTCYDVIMFRDAWAPAFLASEALDHCDPAVFVEHQDCMLGGESCISALGFGDPTPFLSEMPLEIPIAEVQRMRALFTVAFFDTHLAGRVGFQSFLEPEYARENEPFAIVRNR